MRPDQRPIAFCDDMHHETGLPLYPTTTHPGQLTFYEFGVTYREAELAAERRRYEQRKSVRALTNDTSERTGDMTAETTSEDASARNRRIGQMVLLLHEACVLARQCGLTRDEVMLLLGRQYACLNEEAGDARR